MEIQLYLLKEFTVKICKKSLSVFLATVHLIFSLFFAENLKIRYIKV